MQPTVTQKDPAAADWDFNQHLPESDMRWKGEVKVKCCVVGDRDDETPLSCGEEVSDGGNSWKNPTPGGGGSLTTPHRLDRGQRLSLGVTLSHA